MWWYLCQGEFSGRHTCEKVNSVYQPFFTFSLLALRRARETYRRGLRPVSLPSLLPTRLYSAFTVL